MQLVMELMETGNLAYAEFDSKRYVGAEREWCELVPDNGGHRYSIVSDQDLLNRLHKHYVQAKFAGFDHFVQKHIKMRGRSN